MRAGLTTSLSGTDYYNVLVVAFDDRGGRGVPRSSLHILIVEIASDHTSNDGATTIGRLTDRVDLLRSNVSVAFAAGVDDRSCSARGVGPVGTTS